MKLTDEMIEKKFEEWWESLPDSERVSVRQSFKSFKAAFALLAPVIEKQSEALEFYGKESRWIGDKHNWDSGNEVWRLIQGDDVDETLSGGKRARQALAFVSEQLGKMGGEK